MEVIVKKCYQIFNKSCESMPEVETGSVDLVVVDPPFNVGSIFGGVKDTRSCDEQTCLMASVALEVRRVCSRTGKVLVLASDTVFTHGVYIEFARSLQDLYLQAGFSLQQRHFVVIKHENGVELPEYDGEWHDYQAVADAHSSVCHLLAFGLSGGFTGGDVMYTNYRSGDGHPCPFPHDFTQYILDSYFHEDMLVLEPFMGTGRLGQEVLRRGGTYIGYEMNTVISRAAEQKFKALAS